MWTIEVSEDASEEEVNQAILDEVDFDYIRECVAKLKGVIAMCGPLTKVEERTEESDPTTFSKTFHEKRGWICDELESFDPTKIWTLNWDPINARTYLLNGYYFTQVKQGIVEIKTWYIAEKSFEKVDDELFIIDTEFFVWQETIDTEESDHPFYVIDLWELVDTEDLSDEAILGVLSDLYYF